MSDAERAREQGASSEERHEGKVFVHVRGFGFLEIEDPPTTAFIAPPDLNPFLHGDRVSARIEESKPGRFSAQELRLEVRPRDELFGSVVLHGGRRHLKVDRHVSNTDWPLDGADALPEGALVVGRVQGERAVVERTVEPADESLERVLVRHGVRTRYPAEALEEASTAGLVPLGQRRDLRDLTTITIDAPTSRDLDDALSVLPAAPDGALRLLVSIADVDSAVPEDSALDVEARERGTSVYLAGQVIPMLPPSLSEDLLSLLPQRERPAMTVELRIDTEGGVTATDVYPTLIRSTMRLSYEQVAAFLDDNDEQDLPEAVCTTLRWLRTAASRISTVRVGRGGVELLREEAYVTVDEETREPTRIRARVDTSAHELVERLMVACNEAVARWLDGRGLPGVYRVHEDPSEERVEELADIARRFGFEPGFGRHMSPLSFAAFEAQFKHSSLAPAMRQVLGKVLGPARYTVHPGSHFGLAAPLYLHFTSPIRRYADLAVHRVIKRYLAGDRDQHARDPRLEQLAQHLNDRTQKASKAEQERLRMVSARLFTGRVGEEFRGNIVRVKHYGLVVALVGTGVSGTLAVERLTADTHEIDVAHQKIRTPERDYTIGDSLRVRVIGAKEELGRIDLEPVT